MGDKATGAEKIQFAKEAMAHKLMVGNFLAEICHELMLRAIIHDDSKLGSVELDGYASTVPKLKGLTYGTAGHKAVLNQMRPAIAHHQANNDHHPEYFADAGVNDMTLVHLLEMICDWVAASRRGGGVNIIESLPKTCARLGIDKQLATMLYNTVTHFHWEK